MDNLSPALAGDEDNSPAIGGHLAAQREVGTLFDVAPFQLAVAPVPFEGQQGLSADRKRTARNEQRIAEGLHPFGWPLREPVGEETCKTCQHARRVEHHDSVYWKCYFTVWTHGAGTDLRLKWPACERWETKRPGGV